MKDQLNNLKTEFSQAAKEVKTPTDLENLENKFLSRKSGLLTSVMKGLKDVAREEVAEIGQLANEVKIYINSELEQLKSKLAGQSLGEFDFSLPGQLPPLGHLHLVTEAIREISSIFEGIGFQRVKYPEVEWDYYAFESLNMPGDHPARDEWETFFIDRDNVSKKYGKRILTPHTSSGQVREMEKGKLPIRMMNISKTYRRQIDVSHTPMFHQFEGLVIDKDINITHLKGTIDYFVKKFFGADRTIRLRPHHFQFTEPSFEVDISCGLCHGTGKVQKEGQTSHPTDHRGVASHAEAQSAEACRMCKEGWLELAGAGMVHPNVLKFGGVDPSQYSGFAFGWGVERCYTMKAGLNIDDIRLLYKNDLRFNQQF